MQESNELKELARAYYHSMENNDESFFRSTISHDEAVLSIGSDPDEWWVGYEAIIKVYLAQLEAMQGFSMVSKSLRAYAEGTVGWIADQADLVTPDGQRIPVRWTAVCHQEDGAWKFVQAHLSMGISNEDALGQELPTEG